MEFKDFVQWGFLGLLTFFGSSIMWILLHLKNSVDLLNERVAVVIERSNHHDQALSRLDERLRRVEVNG